MGALIYNCTNCRRGAHGTKACKATMRNVICSNYKEKAAPDGNQGAAWVKHPNISLHLDRSAFGAERQELC